MLVILKEARGPRREGAAWHLWPWAEKAAGNLPKNLFLSLRTQEEVESEEVEDMRTYKYFKKMK